MIKLENLSKKFNHRAIAGVHDINLQLKKGEILAIMGPNGSGKSTLLNLITGKIQPDSGSIQVKGKTHLAHFDADVPDMNVQKFLIQKTTLDIDQDKKIQLSRDMADIFEFTFQLRQNLSELSQGQKQKVLMSSELINNPEILLLDEPFNHLDPFTRHEILDSLFKYIKNKEMSVIWVTHDRNEAMRLADKLMLMNFGKVAQTGLPHEVALHPKNLFVAQFLGYKNFIPVSRSGNQWKTPWGEWTLNPPMEKDEALLVIPTYAWEVHEDSSFRVKVLSRIMVNLIWELEVEAEDKKFIVHLSPSHSSHMRKILNLRARVEDCFLLPL